MIGAVYKRGDELINPPDITSHLLMFGVFIYISISSVYNLYSVNHPFRIDNVHCTVSHTANGQEKGVVTGDKEKNLPTLLIIVILTGLSPPSLDVAVGRKFTSDWTEEFIVE